jgi:hypothetical protein
VRGTFFYFHARDHALISHVRLPKSRSSRVEICDGTLASKHSISIQTTEHNMAGKEATVYIVDQGSSMGECHNGRIETDLDYGMRYVWDKIAETMTANRTTLEVGVIGFRTDETDNELAPDDPDAYSNICIMKALGAMQISHLQYLQTRIKASDTDHGDAISAIVIAIQLIKERTTLKTGLPAKVARKIVLLTDGQGAPYDDEIDPIASKINEENIELVVVYVLPGIFDGSVSYQEVQGESISTMQN